MLKRLLSMGAAALAALGSGCGDGPATVSGWRSPSAWSSMVYASSHGPLLLVVHGAPFGEDALGFRARVAQAMTNQIIGRPLAFTIDPEAAPQARYRVVLAFNPPDDTNPRALCEGRIATAAQPRDKLTVHGAFCDGSDLLASVTGWVAGVKDDGDHRFAQLMGQAVRDLFGNPPN
ncbi:MAG TPA: hypothetical protein VL974_01775 [Magnetospirillum sp.]|jgi:hypothetical protein|nr:hypothetical protein [Magnetospirillum sp.]